MDNDEKIIFTKDNIEKIHLKLEGILLMTEEKEIITRVEEILEVLDNVIKINEIPIKDIIHNKMNETRYVDEELSFKLYMLYRKLSDGKIDEQDARKAYKLYINEII